MLARAKYAAAQHPDAALDLGWMDAQQLAFAGQTFDAVVGTFVFCSVPDPVLGLREALRVAKPGGSLLLLEHMRAKQAVVGQAMQALDPAVHWLTGVHIARRTVHNVRTAGWQIESVTPLSPGDIFRVIEARKP
jgi:ubiquinone/menaquinone biosynthesis C-methylase UbiE